MNYLIIGKNELLDEDYFEVLKFYNEIPFLIEFLLEHDQFNIVYHCFHLIYDWNKEVALQLLCDSYIKKVYENDNVYDFSSDLRSIHFFDDYDDEIIIKDELFYRLKEKFKNKPQFLKEIELLEKQMEERYESMR